MLGFLNLNVRSYNQDQNLLFPPHLRDRLPDDHLAVIINDIVESLDLSPLYIKVPMEGAPSYHPKMMLKVLIYAYAKGIFSSRQIAQALYDNIPFIYLSGWQIPDFRTICDFRKNNLEEFKAFFKQVMDICKELGMVKLGYVAIDGSKVKANASDSKTYDAKRINREIENLINQAEGTDTYEDSLYGKDSTGNEVPEDIRNQKRRIERLRELKEKLNKSEKDKINKTDPHASFMKTREGVKTSYNAQVAVDNAYQVIVANDVTNEASDTDQLHPMTDQVTKNTLKKIDKLIADSGYSSGENIAGLNNKEIDAYIPDREYQANERREKKSTDDPFHKGHFSYCEQDDTFTCPKGKRLLFSYYQKRRNKEPLRVYQCSRCYTCEHFGQCTKNKKGRTISIHPYDKELKAMRAKLDTPEGKAIYGKRKIIVEPVFGQIKRVMGFTTFMLRGLAKVKGEFNLVCLAHNLRKIASFIRKCPLGFPNLMEQTVWG